MMRTLVALAILASTVALGQAADASCAPLEPLLQRVVRADAIVFGTVVSAAVSRRELMVRVHTVYKGHAPDLIAVQKGPEFPGAPPPPGGFVATSVDYQTEQGSDHTFYLSQHSPAGFSTNACTGSHAGDLYADERTVLGAGSAPQATPGGAGSATDTDRAVALAIVLVSLGATFVAARGILARPARLGPT
jgi:hypothetical protein